MQLALFLILSSAVLAAQSRSVAITIDDLPRDGDGGPRTLSATLAMTRKLLAPLRDRHVPVTGFVNEGRDGYSPADVETVARLWLEMGADLGNHSRSHLDFNRVSLETYTSDIIAGEGVLRKVLSEKGKKLEYFRHPYLFKGPTLEKKLGLETFLKEHDYREAPVTLDNADYQFAAAYTKPALRERARREYVPYMESIVAFFEQRSGDVLGRDIPQILLIHASDLNADTMPQLLDMFVRRGYRFVSLTEALADETYRVPDEYVGTGGFSWFHRWSKTKGQPEPDPPAWLTQ